MAANSSGGGDPGAEKNVYYIFWLITLIVIVVAILWYYFQHQLKAFFIWVKTVELTASYWVLSHLPDIQWLSDRVQPLLGSLSADLDLARQVTPGTLSLDIADLLSQTSGSYVRYPVAILLFFLCIAVYKLNVHMSLKHKYNMKTLSINEKTIWPQIKIVTKLDLLKEDLDEGPWSMALTPMQYAKRNKLIIVKPVENRQKFSKTVTPEYSVELNIIRTERIFSAQLGKTLRGVEYFEPHRKAIFVALAARGCRDSKVAKTLVAQLANSAADGTLDCSGVEEYIKKYSSNTRIKEIMANHAFEFSFFISLLLFAREDGVVASSDFLWVKPLDRRFWYVLNNVGRQTPCVEVGGIFNHWNYEMALKRPLNAPRVDGAVKAMELAISEILYIPSEEEKAQIHKQTASEPA